MSLLDPASFAREVSLLLQYQTSSPGEALRLLEALHRVILLGQPLPDHQLDGIKPTPSPDSCRSSSSRDRQRLHRSSQLQDGAHAGSWERLHLCANILLQHQPPCGGSSSSVPAAMERPQRDELRSQFYWRAFTGLSDVMLSGTPKCRNTQGTKGVQYQWAVVRGAQAPAHYSGTSGCSWVWPNLTVTVDCPVPRSGDP